MRVLKMAHEILSIKLSELEEQIARLISRIQLSETADRAQRVLCERGPYRKRRMGQPGYSQSRQGLEYPER